MMKPNALKNLFSFYLFNPLLLPTFAHVPRYSDTGKYILLITRAFKDIIHNGNFDNFYIHGIIGSKTLTYLSLLYLFIGIVVGICQLWMYKIKGRELLFIFMNRAVEGLHYDISTVSTPLLFL